LRCGCAVMLYRPQAFGVSTFTIHGTPNLSVSMPKDELQRLSQRPAKKLYRLELS
jgi:hypothetical protein